MSADFSRLTGLWVDRAGEVHLTWAGPQGQRLQGKETSRPFAWLSGAAEMVTRPDGVQVEELAGPGVFTHLATGEEPASFEAFLKAAKEQVAVDVVRPAESQFLLQRRGRLFADMSFDAVRRCQLDIETFSADGGFPDAARPGDRVLAIGLRFGARERLLVLAEMTDAAEKALLEELNSVLAEEDPEVIEGHNIYKFDLDYLRLRAKRHKVACAWGRYGQRAVFRRSRFKVAERLIDFPRCDLPGRTVVDTYFLTQLYDVSTRELTAFGLKDVAVYFGITVEDDERTYLKGDEIQQVFFEDRERFLAYLRDDLRETKGIADLLLPTYFEQAKSFPILLQEATLRGTTNKIDLLFLEEYFHARQACPVPGEVSGFAGGFTKSFQEGVFRDVLHFDVASLYPSLLLHIGRNPGNDALGVFIPLLKRLREYRLRYKQIARTGATPAERAEAQARQASYKILINSFYGYLGFTGARFGDGDLAAEVTQRGRDLLQALIDAFAEVGCTILEADTDGIYLASPEHFAAPEKLLDLVGHVLPSGIELEYDGQYAAMFCYKSKNYALYDGERIILRGSALRSRGMEPFLKKLSDQLIGHLLGTGEPASETLLQNYREQLAAQTLPVKQVAKTETLNQNPDAYERLMAAGGKPRRASAEVALRLTPRPKMGDRVTYFIGPKAKGQTSDWQRAQPIGIYDIERCPYDPSYYLKKLDEWEKRYASFLTLPESKPDPEVPGTQGELF